MGAALRPTDQVRLAPRRVPIRHGWVTPPCIWTFLSSLGDKRFFSILLDWPPTLGGRGGRPDEGRERVPKRRTGSGPVRYQKEVADQSDSLKAQRRQQAAADIVQIWQDVTVLGGFVVVFLYWAVLSFHKRVN